jgi:hypothetical protein
MNPLRKEDLNAQERALAEMLTNEAADDLTSIDLIVEGFKRSSRPASIAGTPSPARVAAASASTPASFEGVARRLIIPTPIDYPHTTPERSPLPHRVAPMSTARRPPPPPPTRSISPGLHGQELNDSALNHSHQSSVAAPAYSESAAVTPRPVGVLAGDSSIGGPSRRRVPPPPPPPEMTSPVRQLVDTSQQTSALPLVVDRGDGERTRSLRRVLMPPPVDMTSPQGRLSGRRSQSNRAESKRRSPPRPRADVDSAAVASLSTAGREKRNSASPVRRPATPDHVRNSALVSSPRDGSDDSSYSYSYSYSYSDSASSLGSDADEWQPNEATPPRLQYRALQSATQPRRQPPRASPSKRMAATPNQSRASNTPRPQLQARAAPANGARRQPAAGSSSARPTPRGVLHPAAAGATARGSIVFRGSAAPHHSVPRAASSQQPPPAVPRLPLPPPPILFDSPAIARSPLVTTGHPQVHSLTPRPPSRAPTVTAHTSPDPNRPSPHPMSARTPKDVPVMPSHRAVPLSQQLEGGNKSQKVGPRRTCC